MAIKVRDKHSDRLTGGFTLVEIMISMAVSGVIIAAIYSAYTVQHRTSIAQEAVTEMQQNLRAALMRITREVRLAGYDPTTEADAGIISMKDGHLGFTQDISNLGEGNGDTADDGETIEFGFTDATSEPNYDVDRNGIPDLDADGNGVPDAASLGRQASGVAGYQHIADNIQAIEFRYLDTDGNVTTVPSDVRTIQISILARASRSDPKFTNTLTYTPASGIANNWGPYNDNYRRRLLITRVQCRNMGVNIN